MRLRSVYRSRQLCIVAAASAWLTGLPAPAQFVPAQPNIAVPPSVSLKQGRAASKHGRAPAFNQRHPDADEPANRVPLLLPGLPAISRLMAQADAAREKGEFARALQLYAFCARHDSNDALPLARQAEILIVLHRLSEARACALKAIAREDLSESPHKVLGRIYLSAGNAQEALSEFKRACAMPQTSADSHLWLADLLSQMNQPEEAARQYEKVCELDPSNSHARACLAAALGAEDKLTQAIAVCRRAPHLSESSQLQWELGLLYLQSSKQWEAVECFKQCRDLDPHDPLPFQMLAFCSGVKADWDSALDYAQSYAQVVPDNCNALQMVAWATYACGDLREARARLEDLISLQPKSPELHNELGMVLLDQRSFAAAQDHFKSAFALDSENLPARMNTCMAEIAQGRNQAAAQEASLLLQEQPDQTCLQALAAYAQVCAGNDEAARRLAAKVLQNDRGNVLARITVARLALKAGQPHKAVDELLHTTAYGANSAFVNCELAAAYLADGQIQQAADQAQAALQLAPANLTAKKLLALSLARQCNWDGAVLFLKELVSRNTDDLALRLLLAEAQEKRGDLDSAWDCYAAAHKLAPQSAEALAGMGRLAFKQGKNARAQRLLKQALALDGTNGSARQLQALLRGK